MTARVLCIAALAASAAACGPKPPAKILFEDVSQDSGLRFRHELPGGSLDNLPKSAMGGFAVIDYDGDGKLDVFCVNGGWHESLAYAPHPAKPATSRLYHNLGGMKFEDVTESANAALPGFGLGACVGDADGDGRPDLFVSCYGGSVLLRNKGDGTFEDATKRAGIDVQLAAGAAFLDYDKDGDLDLFVGQYVDIDKPATGPMEHGGGMDTFPGPAAYAPQPAHLYRNKGDGTFEDVSKAAGIVKPGKAMGVVAADFDGDGSDDVLVANDSMANFLWRNKGDGTFQDVAAIWGVAFGPQADERASMGITLADLDGDGREEILAPDTRGGVCYRPRAEWRAYEDRAADWGLQGFAAGAIGWVDAPIDADCDGWTDLYKVHGDLRSLRPQPSFLLGNRSGSQFARLEDAGADVEGAGRSAIAADLDGDGLEDLLVLVLEGKMRVLHNVTKDAGHWVRVRLRGAGKNPLAIGAVVRGRADTGGAKSPRTLVRRVASSSGYLSGPDLVLHFGLGEASSLDDVVVRWPDGTEQKAGSLAAGREHVITRE